MREILFRGKTLDNTNWKYGYYVKQYGAEQIYLPDGTDREYGFDCYHIIPETIGQYTGLTDKNGTKIFEGDIVKSVYRLKQVNGVSEREIRSSIEYGVGWAYSEVYGVLQRFRDGSGVALLSVMQGTNIADCEVIGNIHDNPELLKEREG